MSDEVMCAGYVPGSYQVRGEKQPRCPNEAAYRDVYCWEHRAAILSHHGGYGRDDQHSDGEK